MMKTSMRPDSAHQALSGNCLVNERLTSTYISAAFSQNTPCDAAQQPQRVSVRRIPIQNAIFSAFDYSNHS